jgi:ribosomal protein S18 acetylase RimI-like enzyme
MNIINSAAPGSAAIVEPATWRDLNDLRRLEQACFPRDAWPLWDMIGVLTFPGVVRLKATTAGKIVGFIAADIRRFEDVAWIATLGVLPDYRRQGIAMSLLQTCEDRLRVPRIRLSVRASNQPAIELYTRFGYVHHGVWRRYYSDGEDALVLQKTR